MIIPDIQEDTGVRAHTHTHVNAPEAKPVKSVTDPAFQASS